MTVESGCEPLPGHPQDHRACFTISPSAAHDVEAKPDPSSPLERPLHLLEDALVVATEQQSAVSALPTVDEEVSMAMPNSSFDSSDLSNKIGNIDQHFAITQDWLCLVEFGIAARGGG